MPFYLACNLDRQGQEFPFVVKGFPTWEAGHDHLVQMVREQLVAEGVPADTVAVAPAEVVLGQYDRLHAARWFWTITDQVFNAPRKPKRRASPVVVWCSGPKE
jgi:hypothetical protein